MRAADLQSTLVVALRVRQDRKDSRSICSRKDIEHGAVSMMTSLPSGIRPARARRGAVLSMELVLVLPIFLVLIFAIVEFTMLMSARARVGDVARQAARCMSISGCSDEDAEQLTRQLLGPSLARHCSVRVERGSFGGQPGNIRVDVPMSDAAPDLLWIAGFGLRGRYLSADAPMLMERDVASGGMQRL